MTNLAAVRDVPPHVPRPRGQAKFGDGTGRLLGALEHHFLELHEGAAQTFECLFCGDRAQGTVAAMREYAQAHRAEFHPAAKDRGQRARRKVAA